jgi:pilus assembly protein CpaE
MSGRHFAPLCLAGLPARLRCAAAEPGQAAVELVAMLPLVATFGLAVGHVLAAEATRELAGHAAEAAAIAVGRNADPEAAARAALPEWSRGRVEVRVSGRAVRVRLEPPAVLPGRAGAHAPTAPADAGPKP